MRILNLTNNEISDVQFEISKFPDGQQQVVIKSLDDLHVTIKSRLNNFKDLEIIICTVKSLRELGVNTICLYIPYFLGSRSDRKFEIGSNNYLKDVICPIVNSLKFDSVTVIDPHSDVLEACLNNFKKENNFNLVKFALTDIDNKNDARERIILVSPDAGAYKKVFDVAKEFKLNHIITANKVRDLITGKILKTEIPDFNYIGKYIIVDDICDGGKTFNELAKVIKNKDSKNKIYLIVTHGIFSAGFKELNEYFEKIYCTNSYRDIAHDEYGEKTNIKQLNIF